MFLTFFILDPSLSQLLSAPERDAELHRHRTETTDGEILGNYYLKRLFVRLKPNDQIEVAMLFE